MTLRECVRECISVVLMLCVLSVPMFIAPAEAVQEPTTNNQ